ncbi:MAG: hypothetical protein ACI8PZ_005649 [Myxococcota bacterium]|jgi:hypothetical protein
MNATIRLSHRTQLWCLRHPGALTRAVLSLFYNVEVALYTVNGALTFLERRRDLFGPNYAALGRFIVGDYTDTVRILQEPQSRGDFLGRGRLVADRLPHGFLLSLSDQDAGADGQHAALRKVLWDTIIVSAQERLGDPRLQAIVDGLSEELKPFGTAPTKDQVESPSQRMVIRYMYASLLDLHLTDAQVDQLQKLYYTGGPTSNYTAAILKPFGLPSFLLGGLNRSLNEVIGWIEASPGLEAYAPTEESGSLTKRQWAELVNSLIGIAALGGGGNLIVRMLSETPADHAIDLDDDRAVMGAVLEAARRHAPVNNINVELTEARSYTVSGTRVELPKGTVVAASIGLASVDPSQWPDPSAFDPERPNLQDAIVNFNTLGYHPTGDTGRRTCPGRNVAVAMGMATFRSWRRAVGLG